MPPKIKLFDNIYATKYKSLVIGNTAIIADLHLGYEQELISKGVFIPKTQFKEMKDALKKLIKEYKIKTLVINGDLKHDFSNATAQEWDEAKELINFLSKKLKKIIIIRGNHDNYLKTIIARENVKFYDNYYSFDDICITHGHKEIVDTYAFKNIIIAHDHPSIFLKDDLNLGLKIPCFLYGKFGKNNIIVLPAFSPLFEGVDVLSAPKENFLSPLIKKHLDDFKVVTISDKLHKFPEIRKIKQ